MLKIKIYPFLSKNAFELIVIIWLNETKKGNSHSERVSLRKNLYKRPAEGRYLSIFLTSSEKLRDTAAWKVKKESLFGYFPDIFRLIQPTRIVIG